MKSSCLKTCRCFNFKPRSLELKAQLPFMYAFTSWAFQLLRFHLMFSYVILPDHNVYFFLPKFWKDYFSFHRHVYLCVYIDTIVYTVFKDKIYVLFFYQVSAEYLNYLGIEHNSSILYSWMIAFKKKSQIFFLTRKTILSNKIFLDTVEFWQVHKLSVYI